MTGEVEADGWITIWPLTDPIERVLHAVYDKTLLEPVPEHLSALLEQIDAGDDA